MGASEVVAAFRAAERITTICHENPDADTLGAAMALRIAAERLGKQAEVVSGDVPPPFLDFIPRVGEVRRTPQLDPGLAIVVDGPLSRTGSVVRDCGAWLGRATIANIDHHVSNAGDGAITHVDPAAAATCEMVALLLPELGVVIDREIATCLMAGIVQDTHTFVHPNATPQTLRVAAGLLEAGADLYRANRAIYADKPFASVALWGQMLAGIGQVRDGAIVHAAMTLEMLRATGADPTASEGFVDLLGITRDAAINVLFKEQSATQVRISVRTTERADAVAITTAFGGGGHARAAGCTIDAPLEEARARMLAACESELDRADAGRR
jgi:phosphoesterase RecJ-like protein